MNDSTCESCRTTAGMPHSFHYGKLAGMPTTDPPPVYRAAVYGNMHSTWTTHYDVGGVDAVVLCKRCLTRARLRRAARVLGGWIGEPLVLVLCVLWAAGVVAWAWPGNWAQAAIWFGAGVLAAAAAYAVVYLRLTSEDFAQRTAVELHQQRLRDEGWDAFWTDREFTGLTPH